MTLNEAVNNFITSRYINGCLDKTLNSYTNLLHPFLAFLGADFDMENLTQNHIRNYMNYLFFRER